MLYKKAPPMPAADAQAKSAASSKGDAMGGAHPDPNGWPLQLGNFAYQVGSSSMRGTLRPSRKQSTKQISTPTMSPGMAEFLEESPALGGQNVLVKEGGVSRVLSFGGSEHCSFAAEKDRVLRRQAFSDYNQRVERALSKRGGGNPAPRTPPKSSPLSRAAFSGGLERTNSGVSSKPQDLKTGLLSAPPMRTTPLHLRRAFTSLIPQQASSGVNEQESWSDENRKSGGDEISQVKGFGEFCLPSAVEKSTPTAEIVPLGPEKACSDAPLEKRTKSVAVQRGLVEKQCNAAKKAPANDTSANAAKEVSLTPTREPFQPMSENVAYNGTAEIGGPKKRWPQGVLKKLRPAAKPPIPRTPSPLGRRAPSFKQSDAPVTSASAEMQATSATTSAPPLQVPQEALVTSALPLPATHVPQHELVMSAPPLVTTSVEEQLTSACIPEPEVHVTPAAEGHVTAAKARAMTSAVQGRLDTVRELDGRAADVAGDNVTLQEDPVKENNFRTETGLNGDFPPAEKSAQVGSVKTRSASSEDSGDGGVKNLRALPRELSKPLAGPVHISAEALREVGSRITLGALLRESATVSSERDKVERETSGVKSPGTQPEKLIAPMGNKELQQLDVGSVKTPVQELAASAPALPERILTTEKTVAPSFEDSDFRAGLASLGKLKLKAEPGANQEWVEKVEDNAQCLEIWDDLKEEIKASGMSGTSAGEREKVKWGSFDSEDVWVLGGMQQKNGNEAELEEAEQVIRDWKRSLRRYDGSREVSKVEAQSTKTENGKKSLAKKGAQKLATSGRRQEKLTERMTEMIMEEVSAKAAQKVTPQKKGLIRKTLTLRRSRSKAAAEEGRTRGTPSKLETLKSRHVAKKDLPLKLVLNVTRGTAAEPLTSRHVSRKPRVSDSPMKLVLEGIKIVVRPKEDVSSPGLAHEVTSGQSDLSPSIVQQRKQATDALIKSAQTIQKPAREALNPPKTPAAPVLKNAIGASNPAPQTQTLEADGPLTPCLDGSPLPYCEYTPGTEKQKSTPSPLTTLKGSPLPWCEYTPELQMGARVSSAQSIVARRLELPEAGNQKALAGRIVGIWQDEASEVIADRQNLELPGRNPDTLLKNGNRGPEEKLDPAVHTIQTKGTPHDEPAQVQQVSNIATEGSAFLDNKSARDQALEPLADGAEEEPPICSSDGRARFCKNDSPREEKVDERLTVNSPREPQEKAAELLQTPSSPQTVKEEKSASVRADEPDEQRKGSLVQVCAAENVTGETEVLAQEVARARQEREVDPKHSSQELLGKTEVAAGKRSICEESTQKQREEKPSDGTATGAAAFFRRLKLLSAREKPAQVRAKPEGDQSVEEGLERSLNTRDSKETESQGLERKAEEGARKEALVDCTKEETEPNGENLLQEVVPTKDSSEGVGGPQFRTKLESCDESKKERASVDVCKEDEDCHTKQEGDPIGPKEAKLSPAESCNEEAADVSPKLEANGSDQETVAPSAEGDSATAKCAVWSPKIVSEDERLFGAAAFFLGAQRVRARAPAYQNANVLEVAEWRSTAETYNGPLESFAAQPKESADFIEKGREIETRMGDLVAIPPQPEVPSPRNGEERVFNAAAFFGQRTAQAPVMPRVALVEVQGFANQHRIDPPNEMQESVCTQPEESNFSVASTAEDKENRRGSDSGDCAQEVRGFGGGLEAASHFDRLRLENERLKAQVVVLQGERTRIAKQMEANNLKASGNSALKAGSFEEAKRFYNQALELRLDDNSFNAVTYTNRAAANLALGFTIEAMADCAAALRVDPQSVGAVLRRADTCLAIGDWEAALKDLSALEHSASGTDEVRRKAADLREHMWRAPAHLDLYGILELPPRASATALKAAYKRLALRHHPDRAGAHADFVFQYIARAYRILSNPAEKKKYDALLPRS